MHNKLKPKISLREKRGKNKIFPDIDFPKEIQYLNELNKKREKKFKKDVLRRRFIEELLGRSTLVIGVRGKNGIVLGSDRKIIRGGETDFGDKVRTLNIDTKKGNSPIIFAAAGAVGVIEDFLEIFESTLRKEINAGKITSLLGIKILAEDLVESFEKRYLEKLQNPSLHFIFGGLSELTKGEARLYTIGFPGYGEKIRYFSIIGHGSPYARTIGKYLFPIKPGVKNIPFKCREIVPRIAACIYWIGKGVDDYVGGDPQIVSILDNNPTIRREKYKKKEIQKWVKETKANITKLQL